MMQFYVLFLIQLKRLFFQIPCSSESVPILHIQSPLHKQLDRDPGIPDSARNRIGVANGG